MKKKLIIFLLLSVSAPVFAMDIEDIKQPAPAFNRLGAENLPEKQFETVKSENKLPQTTPKVISSGIDYSQYTYADLSLKKLAAEIAQDLDMEREDITEDIKTLWTGAASRSETITYAIYKLSNPDAEKPSQTVMKKIIRPIANFTSVAGIGMGNPVMATSAMISGNLLGAFTSDNNETNYKYSKVTDADMVILVRKVDDLQRELTSKYCDYISSRNVLKMATGITKKRKEQAETLKTAPRERVLIADAQYREAYNFESRKRTEFLTNRSALEQLVGNDVLRLFETRINDREQQE